MDKQVHRFTPGERLEMHGLVARAQQAQAEVNAAFRGILLGRQIDRDLIDTALITPDVDGWVFARPSGHQPEQPTAPVPPPAPSEPDPGSAP